MPRYAALFRAVNLPAYGTLSMADLRALLERLGLRDVQTVLQSGNAVFSSPRAAGALETLIERKLGVRGTGRNWNTVRKLNGLTGGEARGR